MLTATAYTPAYNQADTLERTVKSIRAQRVPFQDICTTVDGGDPWVWEFAEGLGVELYRDFAGEGRGLAASCNTAMRGCETDLLAKIDSDVGLSPQWLEHCLPHFQDERVAGVGGRLFEGFSSLIPDRFRLRFLRQHHGSEVATGGTLFGADCIFRVSALRKVGGWNEKYRTNYEDVDLCDRLMKAGYQLIYEPAAECRHLKRDTLLSALDTHWNYNRWALENNNFYSSLKGAAAILPLRANLLSQWIRDLLAVGDIGLIYPCLLMFFRQAQKDLRHLVGLGKLDRKECDATIDALWLELSDMEGGHDIYQRMLAKDTGDVQLMASVGEASPSKDYVSYGMNRFGAILSLVSPWLIEQSIAALEEEELVHA